MTQTDPAAAPVDVHAAGRIARFMTAWRGRAGYDPRTDLVVHRAYPKAGMGMCADLTAADVDAMLAEREQLLDELAKAVIAAAQFDYRDDDGDHCAYLMPTAPLHRIMPLLEQRGIVVRPGFDGRKHPDLAPNQPAQLDRTSP